MLWIIKSLIKSILAGYKAFELELSNDIWEYRYKKEMNRRKAFSH
ncbi:MAG: hypothetical protein QHH15_00465 [Candidatus Thermoplasmatota archaeon]|nr:hypothetical protein [Candidatus Thermoplasmatota archaeon]MDH7506247.1 hypothetical protein [Candidatus Thermoplasmatota archaeon]